MQQWRPDRAPFARLRLTIIEQAAPGPGLMGANSVFIWLRAPPRLVGHDKVPVLESRRIGEQSVVPGQAIDVGI